MLQQSAAHAQIDSESAKAMMPEYHIGTLSPAAREALVNRPPATDTTSDGAVFLSPRTWRTATLLSKRVVSWDTRIFTFSLDHATQTLGLPVGQHLMIKLRDAKGEAIVRPYTPLSDDATVGTVDVLVKVYFEEVEKGTKGGKMTLALDALCMFTYSPHMRKFCLGTNVGNSQRWDSKSTSRAQ